MDFASACKKGWFFETSIEVFAHKFGHFTHLRHNHVFLEISLTRVCSGVTNELHSGGNYRSGLLSAGRSEEV